MSTILESPSLELVFKIIECNNQVERNNSIVLIVFDDYNKLFENTEFSKAEKGEIALRTICNAFIPLVMSYNNALCMLCGSNYSAIRQTFKGYSIYINDVSIPLSNTNTLQQIVTKLAQQDGYLFLKECSREVQFVNFLQSLGGHMRSFSIFLTELRNKVGNKKYTFIDYNVRELYNTLTFRKSRLQF
jgi:hypothetical protein